MKTWMLAVALTTGLVACTSTTSSRNDAYRQIAIQEDKVVAHFRADGSTAVQKVTNGYYRKLLGTTATGDFVVQDFYSRNDQKQSDPLKILKSGSLHVFGNQSVDGEVILYYANGARLEQSVYENGKLVGNSTAYYPNGVVFHVNQFENGQLNGRSQYFYQDGKLAANLEYVTGRLVNVEGWEANQQSVPSARMPAFLSTLQKIDQQNQAEMLRLAQ